MNTMDQQDLEKLVEKRWKQYRAAEKRLKVSSCVIRAAMCGMGATNRFLRKAHLIRQKRNERIVVE